MYVKRILVVLLITALSLLAPQSAQAIIYGEPDNGEHPNVGSLVARAINPETGATEFWQLCTGTLIDEDVVLTASHCVVGLEPFGVQQIYFTLAEVIDADQDGFVDPGVPLMTLTAVPHPQYKHRANNPFDIAVLLLDHPVTGVEPAELPELGLLDSRAVQQETFTAVGYGTVRQTKQGGFKVLTVGWRREKADQELLSLTRAWATFSMNLATGNGGTCYGDSGGPHFLGDVVASITISGDAPCKATDKTYRLDTPWSQQFLAQFLD
jgi:hypothetical protein